MAERFVEESVWAFRVLFGIGHKAQFLRIGDVGGGVDLLMACVGYQRDWHWLGVVLHDTSTSVSSLLVIQKDNA